MCSSHWPLKKPNGAQKVQSYAWSLTSLQWITMFPIEKRRPQPSNLYACLHAYSIIAAISTVLYLPSR